MINFDELIKVILTLLVIVIVIGGSSYLYSKYVHPLAKLDFQDQPDNVKSAILGLTDKFILNLEACRDKTKNNCVCKDAFIEFPNEVSIKIKNEVSAGNRVNIDCLYNNKVFRNIVIDKAFITYSFYDKAINEKESSEYLITYKEGKATFNAGETTFYAKEKDRKIISNYLYKSSQSSALAQRISFLVYESALFGKTEKEQKDYFEKMIECSALAEEKPAVQVDEGTRKFIESIANGKFEQEIRAQSSGTGITEEKIQEAINNPAKRVEIMLYYRINPNLLMGGLPYQEKKEK